MNYLEINHMKKVFDGELEVLKDISLTVKKGEACADARHVFALMQMDIRQGDQIIFAVDGSDEDAVLDKIRTFCQEEL